MCDEGMALSKSLGGHAIDVQRTMRGIQKRVVAANEPMTDKSKRDSLHAPDGVHLTDLGQLAMGFAVLKGLGAPAEVSSAEVDAAGAKLVRAAGCQVTDVRSKGREVQFSRLDDGLPFNYGIFYGLNYRYVPVPDELSRYLLTVTGLPAGRYEVTADGRSAGAFTAAQLAAGVNVASRTADPWQPGGPWNAQANLLKRLTDARHEVGLTNGDAGVTLPGRPVAEEFGKRAAALDERIVEAQRTVARPQPYRFVVRPVPEKKLGDKK
jgi:hypothetical protein